MIIALSLTALLFAISGFVLGLLGFIQARANALSTHTVQYQPAQQQDISQFFGEAAPEHDEGFEVPNDKIEETILKGFE